MYLTRRRVRYAKTPVLDAAAIFFKSGSLYQCEPEEGYTCVQYQGNKINVLNAVVEIDTTPGEVAPLQQTPAAAPTTVTKVASGSQPPTTASGSVAPTSALTRTPIYIVVVMSNELKKNAANDHGRLATAIHEFMTSAAANP
jgi:hypothetical protein